jgi:hypothetical protein
VGLRIRGEVPAHGGAEGKLRQAVEASWELQEEEWPDCSRCEDKAACTDCPLRSAEYTELARQVGDPLYRAVQRYRADEELGLNRWREEPDPLLQEAIRFVSGETARQSEHRRKWLKENRKDNRG